MAPQAPKIAESVGYDSLTVAIADQPEGADYARGRAILNESHQAYASIDSYRGNIQLSATGQFPGHTFPEQRNLTVHYDRSGRLRLDGRDSNNDPFVILVGTDSASINWNNKIQLYETGREALHAFSGITLYGSLVLPGCLLDIIWKNEDYILPMDASFLDAWATKARLDNTVPIEGHDCHRIVCEREAVTWTVYVDVETKLLRRADCEISELQMNRLKAKGARGGYSGKLLALKRSQLFSIDEVTWIDKVRSERPIQQ